MSDLKGSKFTHDKLRGSFLSLDTDLEEAVECHVLDDYISALGQSFGGNKFRPPELVRLYWCGGQRAFLIR